MPRFRIIKPLPEALVYRNGRRLRLKRFEGPHGVINLAAQKERPGPYASVILCQASRAQFDSKYAQGFDVPAGTPAEQIMLSLVSRGYADVVT